MMPRPLKRYEMPPNFQSVEQRPRTAVPSEFSSQSFAGTERYLVIAERRNTLCSISANMQKVHWSPQQP